jgi:hypothetical protein
LFVRIKAPILGKTESEDEGSQHEAVLEMRHCGRGLEGGNKQDRLRYERRWTHRFKSMTFENPEQLLLVPESYEVETLLDGESPALRRIQHTFKDFRRFLGEVQVTPVDDRLNAK